MIYALDTNIIIHYLKNTPSVHKNFNFAIMRGDDLVISKIINYEMKRGFRVQGAPKKEAVYRELTESSGFCHILDMDNNSWERAERIYADLYRKRLTAGELDILIAAFCIENNFTLVTNNSKHFKNIDGLIIEDWVE